MQWYKLEVRTMTRFQDINLPFGIPIIHTVCIICYQDHKSLNHTVLSGVQNKQSVFKKNVTLFYVF